MTTESIKIVKSKINTIVEVANSIKIPVKFPQFNDQGKIWNNSSCNHFMDSCNRKIDPHDDLLIHTRAVESSTQKYKGNSIDFENKKISGITIILLEM